LSEPGHVVKHRRDRWKPLGFAITLRRGRHRTDGGGGVSKSGWGLGTGWNQMCDRLTIPSLARRLHFSLCDRRQHQAAANRATVPTQPLRSANGELAHYSPTAAQSPHAPWWGASDDEFGLNPPPTAEILG